MPTDVEIINAANRLRENGRVDIVKLAREFDVSVRPIDNITELGTSAYINKEDGTYSIYVNGNQSKQRQRFSIAHEMAHYALHGKQLEEKGILHRSSVQQLSPTEEKKADELAAEILMPDDDIENHLGQMGVDKKTKIDMKVIEQLCERYDVSLYAMIVKLRELNYYVPFINVYE